MKTYQDIVKYVLENGISTDDRTGFGTIAVPGATFKHDMSEGFPLLTTKKMYIKGPFVEMEMFIKGITDKRWLQDRGVHIWDDWSSVVPIVYEYPEMKNAKEVEEGFNIAMEKLKIEYPEEDPTRKKHKKLENLLDKLSNHFEERHGKFILKNNDLSEILNVYKDGRLIKQGLVDKLSRYLERDLGPIYGWQWRHWGEKYEFRAYTGAKGNSFPKGYETEYEGKDQLVEAIDRLKKFPADRKVIVNAWQPSDLDFMALDPCHRSFQIQVIGNKLHLNWDQRSVDTGYGLPYNIAGYGLLLTLIAKELNYEPGILTGNLGNTHIYKNQIKAIKEQLKREPRELPSIEIKDFTKVIDYKYDPKTTIIKNYKPHPPMDLGELAV